MIPTVTIPQRRYHILTAASGGVTTAKTTTPTTTSAPSTSAALTLQKTAIETQKATTTTAMSNAAAAAAAAAAKTTSKPTITATKPVVGSKLLRGELRYVPVTKASESMVGNLKDGIAVAAPPGFAVGGGGGGGGGGGKIPTTATLLQMVPPPDTIINSNNVIRNIGGNATIVGNALPLPPLALISNGSGAPTLNTSQMAPINLLLHGADGTTFLTTGATTMMPGLTGSIVIRNPYVSNVTSNKTTGGALQTHKHQQSKLKKHCSGGAAATATPIAATFVPVLNHEMVKQIVVGTAPPPRTLIKTQKPTVRQIIQSQPQPQTQTQTVLLQQQQQQPQRKVQQQQQQHHHHQQNNNYHVTQQQSHQHQQQQHQLQHQLKLKPKQQPIIIKKSHGLLVAPKLAVNSSRLPLSHPVNSKSANATTTSNNTTTTTKRTVMATAMEMPLAKDAEAENSTAATANDNQTVASSTSPLPSPRATTIYIDASPSQSTMPSAEESLKATITTSPPATPQTVNEQIQCATNDDSNDVIIEPKADVVTITIDDDDDHQVNNNNYNETINNNNTLKDSNERQAPIKLMQAASSIDKLFAKKVDGNRNKSLTNLKRNARSLSLSQPIIIVQRKLPRDIARRRSTALDIKTLRSNVNMQHVMPRAEQHKQIEQAHTQSEAPNAKLEDEKEKRHVTDDDGGALSTDDDEPQMVVLIDDKSTDGELQIDLDTSANETENEHEKSTVTISDSEKQDNCDEQMVEMTNKSLNATLNDEKGGEEEENDVVISECKADDTSIITTIDQDVSINLNSSFAESIGDKLIIELKEPKVEMLDEGEEEELPLRTENTDDVSAAPELKIKDKAMSKDIKDINSDGNKRPSMDAELPVAQILNADCEDADVEVKHHKIKKEKDQDKDEQKVKKVKAEKQSTTTTTDHSQLLCDELIQTSLSTTSSVGSPSNHTLPEHKSQSKSARHHSAKQQRSGAATQPKSKHNAMSTQHVYPSETNTFSTVLNALSNYNMLTWKERIGTANGTPMRFHLNEFNLLEIHERCPPRYRIHTAYEKPIYEREAKSSAANGEEAEVDPLLYLCRRCNCHGPAVDFLAPGFCSLDCLKRESRKRSRTGGNMRKRPRKEPVSTAASTAMALKSSGSGDRTRHSAHTTDENGKSLKQFRWSTYLQGKYNDRAAPIDHFLNPFPTGPNMFEIGMKLEAIDPENCSLFCVCTVVEIQGYRLKLKFDGYESMYDFWINADSMDIFPPGWCAKTNRILQPPKNVETHKFNWNTYLNKQKALPAHRQLFTHLNSSASPPRNPFLIGMHLEAEDLNDTGKLCVATVADVLEDRIRVHFDGWDNCYDYWVDINSPYIHPCGWHQGRQQLIVPPEFENSSFHWPTYIKQQKSGIAAPGEFFEAREAIDFRPQMKLEVVDPRNPSLIRPATVQIRKGHRVKLHLDCWPAEYCFWVEDDSPDMHPIGWCDATGHDLEPPPGFNMRPIQNKCPTSGCRGIGNAKCFLNTTHSTRECCPYAPENWRQKVEKPARVSLAKIIRLPATLPNVKAIPVDNLRQQPPPSSTQQSTQTVDGGMQVENVTTRSSHRSENQRLCNKATNASSKINSNNNNNVKHMPSTKPDISEEPILLVANNNVEAAAGAMDLESCELKIAKQFLSDYGPRLQQNYDTWQRNISFDHTRVHRNPLNWTTDETAQFVEQLIGCKTMASYFKREDIDGTALLMLQQADLMELLGMRLGHAVKLFAHILQLRTITVRKYNVTSAALTTTTPPTIVRSGHTMDSGTYH